MHYSALPISIHSLRVEGDVCCHVHSSCRFSISIHSLRVEGDAFPSPRTASGFHFNPLPPCGGRRRAYALRSKQRHFNPLPPCGGRPVKTVYDIMTDPISIHSLRVEGDCHHTGFHIYCPISIHSLRVEGDERPSMPSCRQSISIHSLRVEGDSWACASYRYRKISIHSLRVEGDL